MSHDVSTVLPRMPLVVQLGFAGSRHLVDKTAHPGFDEENVHALLLEHLVSVMEKLRGQLRLVEMHFLCGLSQIAVGADTIFTQACKSLDPPIKQRILLPQDQDAYFAAFGTKGEHDFTDAEAETARELLRSPHIIEKRVVSKSSDRSERFEDVILELVGMSDVLIAVRSTNAVMTPGGTMDLIERAHARNRPLLEITVGVDDGRLVFTDVWYRNQPGRKDDGLPHFNAPVLPSVLQGCVMRDGSDYARTLMDYSSGQAKKHRGFFKSAAIRITGAHFFATVCAAAVLAFHAWLEELRSHLPMALLFGELVLLSMGLFWHTRLHFSHAARRWATARLVTEVARSVNAMARVTGHLEHLFTLPFPEFLRPLLFTLNFFHLEAQRSLGRDAWEVRRGTYVRDRLTRPKGGQIPYYKEQQRDASFRLGTANWCFYIGGGLALLATLFELLIECHCPLTAWMTLLTKTHDFWSRLPGFLAIILPVLSVAALSLAASFDLEARERTFEEMVAALEQQQKLIEGAKSEHEFVTLVLQTEKRLLGEHVNWFSRRVFTGVT